MALCPPYGLGEVLNCSESSGPRHNWFGVIHVDPTMSTIGPLYPELRTLASAAGMSQLGHTRSIREGGATSGLPESGNDPIADLRHPAFVAAATISPSLCQGCRVGLEAAA